MSGWKRRKLIDEARAAQQPVITIMPHDGSDPISAPLSTWVSALILSKTPEDLAEVFRLVKSTQPGERSSLVLPTDIVNKPIPADPLEFVKADGTPRLR